MATGQKNATATKVASHIPETTPGNESNQAASPANASARQNEVQFLPKTTSEKQALAVRPGRATGPRTADGKSRSSQNAIRHGIFLSALLPSESRRQHQRLLDGLLRYFKPEGAGEEVLVQQIAMNLWRRRRLLIAESALIYEKSGLEEKRVRNQQMVEALRIVEEPTFGLVHRMGSPPNPCIIGSALEYLRLLRIAVEQEDRERALESFRIIYGSSFTTEGALGERFFAWYEAPACEAQNVDASDGAPVRMESNARKLLLLLDQEMRRFRGVTRAVEEGQRAEQRCNARVSLLPYEGALERLLRYEAHLDRQFERTLNQLERLQRMRLGQMVPPPLKLEVSR